MGFMARLPLSIADALDEIALVKRVLDGAVGRSAAEFDTLYEWTIRDTARNILDEIENAGSALPEVLASAGITNPEEVSIFAANAPDENGEENILADQYDDLVAALGENGFGYNQVEYTLAYVFDDTEGTFADPDDLADRFFFTLDKFDIDEAVGEGNINVADAEEYYNAVQALVNRSSDDLAVTDIYEWSVLDSASNIVTAYANNGNQHPPHIHEATLVEINDTAVITFEQYAILDEIPLREDNTPRFEIQSYTLEEAVGIYLEDNSGLVANYIIDTDEPYQAQNLSVADALTYRNAVDVLIGDSNSAARNTQVDGTTLDGLYSWTIEDSAENILAQKSGTEFPPIISEASNITLTDASIVFEDEYLNGLEGLLTPSDLVNVRVDFYYDEDIDITFIENEEFENNYGVLANTNGPLEYVGVSSATAEAEYQRVFDVVDGASNVPPVNIESLVVWTIEDSVENIDVDAPWVELAQAIQLTETELNASQFLKFVTVTGNEVSVLGSLQTDTLTNVSFTPQEAYDNRIAFLDIASSNPGYSLSILSAPVVDFATPFNVADANTLDATLDELISAAGTAPSKLDAYSWRVEDSATNLLDEVSGELGVRDDAGVQNASEVRVTDNEISISQYEALVQLDTFVDDGFVVGYSLEEALDRLPSEFGLAENYTLIDATPFDIGELNAYDAQRIYQLVERLIDGAQNGAEVSVDSLMDWVVKDTLVGYQDIGIKTNNDYLREADGVIITGSGVNGEIENGEGQANRQAFSGTDIAYTEEAGFPASPYSLTYTLNGSETLGDPIIDFSTGAGSDQLFIELTAAEITSLRGDGSGFADKTDAEALGVNEAFAVFSTEEFVNGGADWLADLGLGTGDVVYLLAGNGDTADISDDAQLFRVEDTGTDFDAQLLANFENLDLNNFLVDNWNTNYTIS